MRSLDDGRPFPDGPLAVSVAATWAWGVSLFVGMQVARERGIDVFAVWALANSAALAIFGWAASHLAPGIKSLPALLQRAPVYIAGAPVMQFISALVNLTALRYVLAVLGVADTWWAPIMAAITAYVVLGGLPWVVQSNRLQYGLWMVVLAAGGIVGAGGAVPIKMGLVEHWPWALWTFPMFASGPFLDQQLWQRWFRSGTQTTVPWLRASCLFLAYMALVGLAAIRGIHPWALATVGALVATSTLKSVTEAVGSFAQGSRARLLAITTFTAAVGIVVAQEIDLLTFWTSYASARVGFALLVIAGLWLNQRQQTNTPVAMWRR